MKSSTTLGTAALTIVFAATSAAAASSVANSTSATHMYVPSYRFAHAKCAQLTVSPPHTCYAYFRSLITLKANATGPWRHGTGMALV